MLKTKIKRHIYSKGEIYHIKFGNTFKPEIDDVHLGIIFPIKNCNTMFFCLPLTSAKEKHFIDKKSYDERNIRKLKYKHTYYIKETNSIALFEQFRAISANRIESPYKENHVNVKLTDNELTKIINAMDNFFLKDIINYK